MCIVFPFETRRVAVAAHVPFSSLWLFYKIITMFPQLGTLQIFSLVFVWCLYFSSFYRHLQGFLGFSSFGAGCFLHFMCFG